MSSARGAIRHLGLFVMHRPVGTHAAPRTLGDSSPNRAKGPVRPYPNGLIEPLTRHGRRVVLIGDFPDGSECQPDDVSHAFVFDLIGRIAHGMVVLV